YSLGMPSTVPSDVLVREAEPRGLASPGRARGRGDADDPVHRALTKLALVAVALQPPAKADPPATDNTVAATINLRDIDIGQLLEKMEAKIPYRIAGRVTVQ